MNKTVIFLDIDGVLVTSRSHVAFGGIGALKRAFDPVGVGLVKKLCEEADAKIVICSQWRSMGWTALAAAMLWNGLPIDLFHNDPFTPKLALGRRPEIALWLDLHPPVDKYVIIDDGMQGVTDVQPDVVMPPFDDGIRYEDYLKARKLLGLSPVRLSEVELDVEKRI